MTDSAFLLVVEDDLKDAAMILSTLQSRPFLPPIVVVQDGATALDLLLCRGRYKTRPPRNPSLVILDLQLPRVDGFEVVRQIKTNAKLKSIPTVIFTDLPLNTIAKTGNSPKADLYLGKSADYYRFTEAIESIVSFWSDRQEEIVPGEFRFVDAQPVIGPKIGNRVYFSGGWRLPKRDMLRG